MNNITSIQEYAIADEIARLKSLNKEQLIRELVSLKFDEKQSNHDRNKDTNE